MATIVCAVVVCGTEEERRKFLERLFLTHPFTVVDAGEEDMIPLSGEHYRGKLRFQDVRNFSQIEAAIFQYGTYVQVGVANCDEVAMSL